MPRRFGQDFSAEEQFVIRALRVVICTSLKGSKGALPTLSETALPESRKKPEVGAATVSRSHQFRLADYAGAETGLNSSPSYRRRK
jgi:hypothetical protein